MMSPEDLRFWQEMRRPVGRVLLRRTGYLIGIIVAWVVLNYVRPDIEDTLHNILIFATASAAFWIGVSCGWVVGAEETLAWTRGERLPVEDDAFDRNPFDRDPELWAARKDVKR